nr:acetyltransferase [Desulfobulbaceae bacterium]
MHYDIFNGDADGICALHQLRLAEPKKLSTLVTGVKRDVKLLSHISESVTAADSLTVLDVSMDSNKDAIAQILNKGVAVFYADHHFAGEIPKSGLLEAHIDPSADTCTSLIIDSLLGGRYKPWAVVGAFGDNLHDAALEAAGSIKLKDTDIKALRELGELLNYNGYGAQVSDLHCAPQSLYEAIRPFESPIDFIGSSSVMEKLRLGFKSDMHNARAQKTYLANASGRVFMFPPEPWSRRVAGVFSNEKARERPELAHALLVDNDDGTYLVSVRAPLERKAGADRLCRAFPTGGGRAAAAGVNFLSAARLAEFVEKFTETFSP